MTTSAQLREALRDLQASAIASIEALSKNGTPSISAIINDNKEWVNGLKWVHGRIRATAIFLTNDGYVPGGSRDLRGLPISTLIDILKQLENQQQ